jgi:flavodoxin
MKFKALIVYWSNTSNTRKVAEAIEKGMQKKGLTPMVKRVEDAGGEDFFNYDLVCLGAPSYQFLPPKPMLDFLNQKMDSYRKKGYIKVGAPKVPDKYAIVFCTYSGPHTGLDEAIPAGKYMRQVFEHLGFEVKGEWYVVGEYHGSEEKSTKGRLGDIRGRPNDEDLSKVESDTIKILEALDK